MTEPKKPTMTKVTHATPPESRVQAAAARFESEQRFSAMADQNIVGVAEVDLSGRARPKSLRAW
jgi:hypothetical protein